MAAVLPKLQSWDLQDDLLAHLRHALEPQPLLCDTLYNSDFVPKPTVIGQDDISYFVPDCESAFHPIIVGSIKAVHDARNGLGHTLEIGLPRYATHEMDVVVWNQLSCLADIVDTEVRVPVYTTKRKHFQEIAHWSSGPFRGGPHCGSALVFVPSSAESLVGLA
ncbi:hypothetical protein DFH06DRAFT_1136522 [Mycena polygramma]|nr:hypothetical protein DFH06DRAFT_1136522 [Mycena polygramma]